MHLCWLLVYTTHHQGYLVWTVLVPGAIPRPLFPFPLRGVIVFGTIYYVCMSMFVCVCVCMCVDNKKGQESTMLDATFPYENKCFDRSMQGEIITHRPTTDRRTDAWLRPEDLAMRYQAV